jgi:hypothetical protein
LRHDAADHAARTSAKAIDARHHQWAKQLPQDDDLWPTLVALDSDTQAALFAHCAELSISAVHDPWNRNAQQRAYADTLARALNPDWQQPVGGRLSTVFRPCAEGGHSRSRSRGEFLADAEDDGPEDPTDAEEPSHAVAAE